MIWEPFILALVLGIIVSAGLYFAYLWPSVEPLEPGEPVTQLPAVEPAPTEPVPVAEPAPEPAIEPATEPAPAPAVEPAHEPALGPAASATDEPASPAS